MGALRANPSQLYIVIPGDAKHRTRNLEIILQAS